MIASTLLSATILGLASTGLAAPFASNKSHKTPELSLTAQLRLADT